MKLTTKKYTSIFKPCHFPSKSSFSNNIIIMCDPCDPPGPYRARSCTQKGECTWECRNGHTRKTCPECVGMAFVAAMRVMKETQKRESTPDHIYKALTTRGTSKTSYADRMANTYPCHCGQALMPVLDVPSFDVIASMTGSGKKCKIVNKDGTSPTPNRKRTPVEKPWKQPATTTVVSPKAFAHSIQPSRKGKSDQDIKAVQDEIERLRKEKEKKRAQELVQEASKEPAKESLVEAPSKPKKLTISYKSLSKINRPINQPKTQPINRTINQPINRTINQPIDKPINQPLLKTPGILVSPSSLAFSMEKREAELRQREREFDARIEKELEVRWLKLSEAQAAMMKREVDIRAKQLMAEAVKVEMTKIQAENQATKADILEKHRALQMRERACEERERMFEERERACEERERACEERERACEEREKALQEHEAVCVAKEASITKKKHELERKYRNLKHNLEATFRESHERLEASYAENNANLSVQYSMLCQQVQLAEMELHKQIVSTALDERESFKHKVKDLMDAVELADQSVEDPKDQYLKVVQCLCKLAPLAARIKRADGWFGTNIVPKKAPISALVDVSHQIVQAETHPTWMNKSDPDFSVNF